MVSIVEKGFLLNRAYATMTRNQENGVFCSGNTKHDPDQISKFMMTIEYNILIYSGRNQNRLNQYCSESRR